MLHTNFRLLGFTAIFLLCVTSCTPAGPSTPSAPSPPAKPTHSVPVSATPPALKRKLTPFEQSLMREPGSLHGSSFNEADLRRHLDTIALAQPASATYQQLLQWLHEDYRPLVIETANFPVDIHTLQPKPTEDLRLEKRTHFAILLDASGSMAEKIDSNTKMHSAKRAISSFVSKLPNSITISLRVYGHKGSSKVADKALSCQSTEAIVRATGYEAASFAKALNTVNPTGWTPIATALEAMEQDIPSHAEEVHLYLVSDGEETCGGNPVQVMARLRQQAIRPQVHIIGFRVDNQGQKALKQMAAAGAGTFTYVDSAKELNRFLENESRRLMQEWLRWGQAAGSETLQLRQQKLSDVDRLFRAWKSTSDREEAHLKAALRYLQDAHYSTKELNTLAQLIHQRTQQLASYRTNTRRSLQEAIKKNGWKTWNGIWDEGTDQIKDQWNHKEK
ncbi:VWA domain-containing protein [Laceyella putida]|uniref:VWA domain-containing protein n=1 Tax=Laceyella putida TaxID=110101 RepID=A0ABW2RKI9_9BACL